MTERNESSPDAPEPLVSTPEQPVLPAWVGKGWHSTEFWISLIISLSGVYLIAFKDKFELGSALLGLVGLSYAPLRTALKNNALKAASAGRAALLAFGLGSFLKLALLATALSLASGCAEGQIKAEALNGMVKAITKRHDAYVQADPKLDQLEKDTFLRSSKILNLAFAEALKAQNGEDKPEESAPKCPDVVSIVTGTFNVYDLGSTKHPWVGYDPPSRRDKPCGCGNKSCTISEPTACDCCKPGVCIDPTKKE